MTKKQGSWKANRYSG